MKTKEEWSHSTEFKSFPDLIDAIQSDARADLLDRLAKAEREILGLKSEEVRRIRHLNRLGTWASRDRTGPVHIQAWVLSELKAALGSAYEPTAWQPATLIQSDDLKTAIGAIVRNAQGCGLGSQMRRLPRLTKGRQVIIHYICFGVTLVSLLSLALLYAYRLWRGDK